MQASDLEPFVEDFLRIYPHRPIQTNTGGMGLNHSFGLYAALRHLRPSLVVESGVWRGQSTWIIEQAAPGAELVCIDPRPDLREYSSPKARYETLDFAHIDWSAVDTEDALCFFDDHQNAYSRLMEVRWWGFRRAIMEDNFPVGQGDCYSLRHAMRGVGHPRIQMSPAHAPRGRAAREREREEAVLWKYSSRQQMLREPNDVDRSALARNVACYLELPALLLNTTHNWGGPWEGDYSVSTPPVYDRVEDSASLRELLDGLDNHRRELMYGYLCYVELC